MAPPIPASIFPGMAQLARPPVSSTSMAPSTVTSSRPLLTKAKEAALSKTEPPG